MYVRPRPRFRPRNAGGVPFSPALLFTSGVAGAWYDPSDINNYMAGLGPELVAPIDFNTGWTASGAAITVNSATSFTSAGVSNYYIAPFTVGRWYAVTINATFTGASANLYNSASATNQITPLGLTSGVSQTFYFQALATQFNIRQSSAGTVTVNSIAVAELTGIANATLFQDSAGTTPVTAVEQPVGLMLDKSQGLVLGSELVANWATQSSWSVGVVGAVFPGTTIEFDAISDRCSRPSPFIAGKTYLVTFSIVVTGSAQFTIDDDGVGGGAGSLTEYFQRTATGSYSFYLRATTSSRLRFVQSTAGTISLTSFSAKEIAGNHASQATAASRPVLRARYNLLTYSEQFDNAAWTKDSGGSATANTAVAPDGTTTADTLTDSAVSGQQRAYQTITVPSGAQVTFSVCLKQGTRRYARVTLSSGDDALVVADLQAGTIAAGTNTTTWSIASSSITALGDGWYRVSITASKALGTIYYPIVALCNVATVNANGYSYTGNGSTIYVWGAQLVTGSSAGTYQRIAAATDYATAGFLPYLYFVTDDSFGTNSIDFSATDKMYLCAGVTKLSDAAVGIIAELSTAAGSGANLGTFNFHNQTTPVGYRFSAGSGTVGSAYAIDDFSTFTAPVTNVVSGIANLAGATINDEISARVNGAVPTQSISGTTSTGNFGNWPLFIGRRNNASSPFNGNLYGLIVCGKMLSASELSATESWMNARTGAY